MIPDELTRAALERQPFGIAILSLPGLVFEYVNPAFQAFAPGKEMVGLPNDQVFPEMSALGPPVLAALAKGRVWREEDTAHRIRRTPDGPLETMYGTFEVSLLSVGSATHLLVAAIDTTARVHLAKENARLHEEVVRRLGFAQTLGQIDSVIHSSLSYDEIMQRALEEGTKALGARAGAVFTGLDGESEARYIYGFPKALLGRRFHADVFPFSRLMEETKQPVPVETGEMRSLMNAALARIFRVRSLLAIPLVVRGTLVGGIGLVYGKPHEFDDIELGFSAAFGASVSLALENAELFRRQERVADTLQEALLTLPHEIRGLEFAHAYHSATEAVKVGGDFYDLFELEHETVGITVGDISGKGLDAAALTALVKNAIRAQATEKRHSPADVMRVVNKVLFDASSPETFATVFFGLLDCRTGLLVYCNAGHTTAGVMRAGGVQELPANAPLIGAFELDAFQEAETSLGEGDLLFMYTDGVVEARHGETFFGEERLWRLLAEAEGAEPADVIERVMDDVVAFTGGRLTDDVAVLAVRRRER